jgi:hypothetical protein
MGGESICSLVDGRVGDWHGLQPFAINDAPGCIGEQTAKDWLKFSRAYASYRIFRRSLAAPEVWLFSFDGKKIELVEIFGLPASFAPEAALAVLGQPELMADYPGAAQIQRPLRQPGEELRESIYGERGLALLLGYAPDRRVRPVRVRGFESMSAQEYYRRFVELPEIEIPA